MKTVQVDILNPKAGKLLQDLAGMKLISIKEVTNAGFLKAVMQLRKKAKKNKPSFDDITKEVESVRAKRYRK
jgi:hypothetical protein